MAKIYKQPFAHSGDAIAIPSASQPDGKMSSADGWTPDYQLLKTDPNYKPVGRQEMNGVFKEVTEALGQVQVQGAASWSEDGAPYPVNAQVYHNGKQWIALRANGVVPTEGADWSAVIPQKTVMDALATKADKTTSIIAGTGLTGGGNLTANRTLSIDASHTPVGVGQTWQDVTGSRSVGTTYTNTTGRTIFISVTSQDLAARNSGIYLTVDGNEVASSVTRTDAEVAPRANVSCVIPNGSTYSISIQAADSINSWWELR